MFRWLKGPIIGFYPPIAYMMFVLAIALGTNHAYIPAIYDYLSELTAFLSDTCLLLADDEAVLGLAKRVEVAFLEIHLVNALDEVKILTPKPKSDLFVNVFVAIIDDFLSCLGKRDTLASVDLSHIALNVEYVYGNATKHHLEDLFNLGGKGVRREREASKKTTLPDGLIENVTQRVMRKPVDIRSPLIFEELWRAGGPSNVKSYPFPAEKQDEAKPSASSRFRDHVFDVYVQNPVTTTRKRKRPPTKIFVSDMVRIFNCVSGVVFTCFEPKAQLNFSHILEQHKTVSADYCVTCCLPIFQQFQDVQPGFSCENDLVTQQPSTSKQQRAGTTQAGTSQSDRFHGTKLFLSPHEAAFVDDMINNISSPRPEDHADLMDFGLPSVGIGSAQVQWFPFNDFVASRIAV